MKGDLQFGLIMAFALLLAVSPRLLPEIEDPSSSASVSSHRGAEPLQAASVGHPQVSRPTSSSDPHPPLRLPEMDFPPAGPSKQSDALSSVVPDGYRADMDADRAHVEKPIVPPDSIPPSTSPVPYDPPSTNPADGKPSQPMSEAAAQQANGNSAHGGAKGPVHPYFSRFLSSGEYFVRTGDTLTNIAQRLYQDPTMAETIRAANAKLLSTQSEPSPGMRLRLPVVP